MSVNDAAAAMGMSASHISEIERGKKRVHHDVLEAYSKTFDMPISSIYLIAESAEASTNSAAGAVRRKIAKIIDWIATD